MVEENHTDVATVIFIHNTGFKKKLLNMANILVEHFLSSSAAHV